MKGRFPDMRDTFRCGVDAAAARAAAMPGGPPERKERLGPCLELSLWVAVVPSSATWGSHKPCLHKGEGEGLLHSLKESGFPPLYGAPGCS